MVIAASDDGWQEVRTGASLLVQWLKLCTSKKKKKIVHFPCKGHRFDPCLGS